VKVRTNLLPVLIASLATVPAIGVAASSAAAVNSAAASTKAVPTHCTDAQLRVTEGHSVAVAGHIMFPIHFRNVSAATCTLHGYPGAAGLDKHGKQAVQAAWVATGYTGGLVPGEPIPYATLKPGALATARVEGSDVPGPKGKACKVLHGLLVTPPNDTAAVLLKHSPPSCGLQIHPAIVGSSGTQY
jgi:hypothetical protein